MSILDRLNNGHDLKELNIKELNALCLEIRDKIVSTVDVNGGHLSSNLGSVELTVALHYVFDIPTDKLIFDVGHQSYAHKILTNRNVDFSTLRQKGGISGFPDPNESESDAFIAGHAGTSIASGLGYCYSRDITGDDYYVISVVGDASLFNGENLEAITSSRIKPNKFLLILNDNGMSINKNDNGFYKIISKITIKKGYSRFNSFLAKTIGKTFIGKFLRKIKRSFKRTITSNSIVDNVGLKYVGKFDGHDLKTLINLFKDIKELNQPTFLHLKTVKGKGNYEAEKDSTRFHGVSKNLGASQNYFSKGVSQILNEKIIKYPNIVAITAGMKEGVGLLDFSLKHSKSFVDVGIQEEFAVTLAGGMAKGGAKPIVFTYSTFMQRAYDQILHDVCLQNLPVILCLDRAGFVGSDGKTHQGLFDISYLSHLPNIKIFAPINLEEFSLAIETAIKLNSPVAIRYPSGQIEEVKAKTYFDTDLKWDILSEGDDGNVILAVGSRLINLALECKNISNKNITVINARCIKPLDFELLDKIYDKNIIVLEENAEIGGFGSQILTYYNSINKNVNVSIFGVKDKFIEHATVSEQLESCGFTPDNIISKFI